MHNTYITQHISQIMRLSFGKEVNGGRFCTACKNVPVKKAKTSHFLTSFQNIKCHDL